MGENLREEFQSMSVNNDSTITCSGAESSTAKWKDLKLSKDFALKYSGKTISAVASCGGEPTIWFKLLDGKGTILRNFLTCRIQKSFSNRYGFKEIFLKFENQRVKDCQRYFETKTDKKERKVFQAYLFVKWLNDNNRESTNFFQLCLSKDKQAWYERWLAIVCGLVKIPNPPMTNGGSSKPCGKGSCNFCKESSCMVSEHTEIKTPSQTIPLTHQLTCEDKGIYVATCTQKGCGAQYVGKIKNPFNKGCIKARNKSPKKRNNANDGSTDSTLEDNGNDDSVLENNIAEHYKTKHKIIAEKPEMHTYSLTFVDKPAPGEDLNDLKFIWIYRVCPIINKNTSKPSNKLYKNTQA